MKYFSILLILYCNGSNNSTTKEEINILTPTSDDRVIVWCVEIEEINYDIFNLKVNRVTDILTSITLSESRDVIINDVVTAKLIDDLRMLSQVKYLHLGECR